MSDRLSAEEVAILIKARQIRKAKAVAEDADVKSKGGRWFQNNLNFYGFFI
jgi:hypothetical protein